MSLKMKLALFALIGSVCARGEKTGEEIVYLIEVEVVLLPLIVLCLLFLYLNYKEILQAVKSVQGPTETSFEMKPLIRPIEPEMEP